MTKTNTPYVFSEKEKLFIESVKKGDLTEVKQLLGEVHVDFCEEDGMTALMHASYKGNFEVVEYLLSNGADVNVDTHKDQYTPLMFAALSGSTDTVRLLLEAGAKPDVVNKIKRTAAQLGAFVGRHDCVSVINNFVQPETIDYYTNIHGLEKEAKLKEHLSSSLHQYVVIPNLNPIKAILFLEKNLDLVDNQDSISKILETECRKAYHNVNEVLSMKVHIFNHMLTKCALWHTNKEGKGGIKGLLKFMLRGRPEDGFMMAVETMLREAVKSFPYAQSNLFQQVVRSLSPVTPGNEPLAISVLTQAINGMQSADFSECCSCCGDRHCTSKCSACKMVRYCNASCQKLHWSNHKQLCAKLKIQYQNFLEQEKLRKEEEEKEKLRRAEEQEKKEKNNEREQEEGHRQELDVVDIQDIKLDDDSTPDSKNIDTSVLSSNDDSAKPS